MNNVLLVTSPGRDVSKAITYALQRAREIDGSLVALAVLDPERPRRIARTLTNVGFVGEKVSDSVVDTVAREQQAQADTLLKEIAARARDAGITCTSLIEEGDPSEVCSRIIQTHNVRAAVLVAEKRSWLTRFLSRAAAVKLPAFAGCEVKVMEG
ncbi:MAG: universal stress protein [Candidatus Binatia bacterium]